MRFGMARLSRLSVGQSFCGEVGMEGLLMSDENNGTCCVPGLLKGVCTSDGR